MRDQYGNVIRPDHRDVLVNTTSNVYSNVSTSLASSTRLHHLFLINLPLSPVIRSKVNRFAFIAYRVHQIFASLNKTANSFLNNNYLFLLTGNMKFTDTEMNPYLTHFLFFSLYISLSI